jgi:hypothetical protein
MRTMGAATPVALKYEAELSMTKKTSDRSAGYVMKSMSFFNIEMERLAETESLIRSLSMSWVLALLGVVCLGKGFRGRL